MIYAQAEDDFPRIEANYLTALGRTAEAEGEKAIWQDLRARLYVSDAELKADYCAKPAVDAAADGCLGRRPQLFPRHPPEVHPRVLEAVRAVDGAELHRRQHRRRHRADRFEGAARHFTSRHPGLEPGPAFSSTAGSRRIPDQVRDDGADIEPQGSNGIAIAPKLTSGGGALLLINPHTSFYFRSELQMTSDEGLDAYGAATWGQFFIYQGFNPHIGWMHTSSGVDNVDEFAYEVQRARAGPALSLRTRVAGDGSAADDDPLQEGGREPRRAEFHGLCHPSRPDRRAADGGKWIAFAMMDRPVEALQQSYLRTRAADLAVVHADLRLQGEQLEQHRVRRR